MGTMRLVGDWNSPKPGFEFIFDEMKYMGQELFNPPSVEGWHTGREWIDGGTLVHRINFTADFLGDINQPGVKDIVDRIASRGPVVTGADLVDDCLRLLGHYELPDETRRMFAKQAQDAGELRTASSEFPQRVCDILKMIVATKEYLYA